MHEADVARFYDFQTTRRHDRSRAAEGFNKMYGIVHPAEQWGDERGLRRGADVREREAARSGLLPDRRMGATPLVRRQRSPVRTLRRSPHAKGGGVGVTVVVARHQRRAPRHARRLRARRPVGLCHLRPHRPGRARGAAGDRRRPARRAGRPRRLHLVPRRARRLQGGPHDHAARPGPLPRRHRRCPRHGGQEVDHRPAARRRLGTARRRHVGLHDDRAVGPRGPRRARRAAPTTTCRDRRSRSGRAGRSKSPG